MIQLRREWRRGSLAVSLLIALALLSLVAAGIVTASGLSSYAVVDARAGSRAFLAAESGLQMAYRELATGVDQDGDGTVGAVGSGTPITIDGATVSVAKSVSGSTTTLTATGTSGLARKKIQATLSGSTGGTPELFWSQSASKQARVHTYSGSAWSAGTAAPAGTADVRWIATKSSPTSSELILTTLDSSSRVNVVMRSGGTWGSLSNLCTNAGTSATRPLDVAYEQTSGEGLICYWNNGLTKIGYRTVVGGTVSSESLFTVTGLGSGARVAWLTLVPRPGTDQVLMVHVGTDSRIRVTIWDGSSWGATTTLETSAATTAKECVAGAWESSSGKAMVVWGRSASNNAWYSSYSGSSWGAATSMGSVGSAPDWVRLASDPGSNGLLMFLCTANFVPYLNNWTGSAWGALTSVSSALVVDDGHVGDVAFSATGTTGLAVYRKLASGVENRVYYRPWTGSAWGAEAAGFTVSANPDWFELAPKPGTSEIYFAVKSSGGILDAARWDGSTLSAKTSISTQLTSTDTYKVFDLNVSSGSISVSSVDEIP